MKQITKRGHAVSARPTNAPALSIEALNDTTIFPSDPGADGQAQCGRIYAANETRFIEANFQEPLTVFAQGWKDPNNIQDTLEAVAPMVPTGRRFEWFAGVNVEEFLMEMNDDDIRSVGQEFKRVEYTSTKNTSSTQNKGLTMRVDLDWVMDGDKIVVPNWQELYTAKILRRLYRRELYRAIVLLSNAANNTAKTWDITADPDYDMGATLLTTRTKSGIGANRIMVGDTGWLKRFLALRGNNNAAKFASSGLTPEQLASLLGIDKVTVSKERYQSTATAKAEVVGNLALHYHAETGATVEDPSNIKRFVSPTASGPYRVFVQQVSAKFVDITVEHYSLIAVTSTLGIEKITIG